MVHRDLRGFLMAQPEVLGRYAFERDIGFAEFSQQLQ